MCPSYRVTRNESDVTRGRANTLRLAISGQIGGDGLASDDVLEALKLCVSCKACRRECPTGVDMARMKIEALAARNSARGGWVSLRDRLVAFLPRYAGLASALAPLVNLRNRWSWLAQGMERLTGISAGRALPEWRRETFPVKPGRRQASGRAEKSVALFADTFNRNFEPENLTATVGVLEGLGYEVHVVAPADGGRPVCCGRTFLSAGMVDEAKSEARRLLEAVQPHLAAGRAIIGIEPSCLLTLRDEFTAMRLGDDAIRLAEKAVMLEELLVAEVEAGRIKAPIGRLEATAHLHTHCHQKALGVAGPVEQALRLVDGLMVKTIESGCCGMAGSFGYQAETLEVSMAMGELALLPAVRAARPNDLVVADGFSCRHQIADGAGRQARHVAQILADAMKAADRT